MNPSQFALVKDGALIFEDGKPVISGFHDAPPDDYSSRFPDGCEWLPVENEDSRPFNVKTDGRSGPTFEVAGAVVKRKYEVRRVR
jgi:hypothetical protein